MREPFWDAPDAPIWRHGYTYGGHPAACAAALATLDILERERLIERVAELEPHFQALVRETFADQPLVGEVRGEGLIAAVAVDPAVLAQDPTVPARIGVRAREHGVISRALATSLQLSPPFVVTDGELTEMVTRLRAAFDAVLAETPNLLIAA